MVRSIVRDETKALGDLWVVCPYPVLARGLIAVFSEEAIVHTDDVPPDADAVRCVLVCSNSVNEVVESVKFVRTRVRNAPVVVFGLSSDIELVRGSLKAGARGFVHAGMESGQIVRAISVAARGEVVIPRDILKDLVTEDDPIDVETLTPRQLEILKLVVEGMTNAEIGRSLYLSESTVKQHLRAAFKSLKVNNRTEAANLLRRMV